MQFLENDDLGKLIVRIMVSVLLLFHGIHKVMYFSDTVNGMAALLASHGLPEILAYGVFLGEVLGPILILIGLFSRIGGALVVINMLFAIGLVQLGNVFALTEHGSWMIEADIFFLLSGLAVVFLGSGRYAVYED